MEVKADEQITGSFCPRCGSETEQTCMWTIGKKDRNRANCTACGWSGYAYQCAKIPLNTATCPDGGILRECYKDPDWGQVNLRTMPPRSSKPGHVHRQRNETWVLVRGEDVWVKMEIVGFATWAFRLLPWYPLFVAAGIGHSVENRGDDEAVILFYMDQVYDQENPDKEPWNPGHCNIIE